MDFRNTPQYTLGDVARALGGLRTSLRDDLLPVVETCGAREPSGCLIIPREVFAYVDFLGALYCGYDGSVDGAGRRKIADSSKAVRFLNEVFGEVDEAYRSHGELVYQMIRHGTVHIFRPHMLRRADGATIEWVTYEGGRRGVTVSYAGETLVVSHIQPLMMDASESRYVLPVSISILLHDLVGAIDVYEAQMNAQHDGGDTTLLERYGSTMAALVQSEATRLNW